MDCLQPPLDEAPAGTWYCPLCEGASTQDIHFVPQPDVHYPTKAPPATELPIPSHPTPGPEHPTKLPPEHIAALRSSSVASSSRLTDRRRHGTVGVTDESEMDVDGEATPTATRSKNKKKQRPKGKTPMRDDSEVEEATPAARSHKRPRVRLSSPAPPSSPTQKSGTGLRIRLPLRDKGKARDDDSSDPPKGMFDDILSPEDRDTAETNILPADKQRFEKSRVAAEVRCFSVLPECKLMVLLGTTIPQTSSSSGRGPRNTWGGPVVATDALLTSFITYRPTFVRTLRFSCTFNARPSGSETSGWLADTQDPVRGLRYRYVVRCSVP